MKNILSLCALLLVAACTTVSLRGNSIPQIHAYTLDNGLKVYMTVNKQEPVIYSEIIVKAGSQNDPEHCTGIAHYLEHMLFKGTEDFGTIDYKKEKPHLDEIARLYEVYGKEKNPKKREEIYRKIDKASQEAAQYAIANEYDNMFQAIGGTKSNAYTSYNKTVYQGQFPKNALEQWAILESNRFHKPVFRLFQSEIEVVFEEKNADLDDRSQLLREKLDQKVFKKHPYGQKTILGSREHLRNPSVKEMKKFYETYYVPNNMAIVLAGDLDPERTLEMIKKYFSAWQPRELPPKKVWKEEPLVKVEEVHETSPGQEYVTLMFRTLDKVHPDMYPLLLLNQILGDGELGLINVNLNKSQKVLGAASGTVSCDDYYCQYLYAYPKKGQSLQEARDLLLAEVENVKKGEFDATILPGIISSFETETKVSFERNDSLTDMMGRAFLDGESWEKFWSGLDQLRQVTKKDIIRVANKYFSGGYVAAYMHNGAEEVVEKMKKLSLTPVKMNRVEQSSFVKKFMQMKVKPTEPVYIDFSKDFTKSTLKEGVELWTVKNPRNDIFTLTYKYEYGTEFNSDLEMVPQLMYASGTLGMSSVDISKAFYAIGCNYVIDIGRLSTEVYIYGLEENLEKALNLLHTILETSDYGDDLLNRLVKMKLPSRQESKSELDTVEAAFSEYVWYGADSNYLKKTSDGKLKELKADDVRMAFKELMKMEHKINYVGMKSHEDIVEIVNRFLPDEQLEKPPGTDYRKLREDKKPTIYLFHRDKMHQARVNMHFTSTLYNPVDSVKISLYNELMDGTMGGIISQEIRESKGLAYSAWAGCSSYETSKEKDYIYAGLNTQADKLVEALESMTSIIYNPPFSQGRFQTVLEALKEKHCVSRTAFRSVLDNVQAWGKLSDTKDDPRRKDLQILQEITFEDIVKFSQEKTSGRSFSVGVIADKNNIDMKKLSENWDIKLVSEKDIYCY